MRCPFRFDCFIFVGQHQANFKYALILCYGNGTLLIVRTQGRFVANTRSIARYRQTGSNKRAQSGACAIGYLKEPLSDRPSSVICLATKTRPAMQQKSEGSSPSDTGSLGARSNFDGCPNRCRATVSRVRTQWSLFDDNSSPRLWP
jgi:hypothetical protein